MSGMTDDELFGRKPIAEDVAPKVARPTIAPLPQEADPNLIARAMVAEGDPTPESWRNVGGAVLNRMAKSGKTASQILSEPGQFETFSNGRIQGVNTQSPQYQQALSIAQGMKAGDTPYDSFFQPNIVKQRGTKPPFDPSQGTMVGTQLFGNAYGGTDANSDWTPADQAKWDQLQVPGATTPEGRKTGAGGLLVKGQKATAAQDAFVETTQKKGRKFDPNAIGGTADLPYFLQKGGVIPATPGAHYVDLDGIEHVVPGGALGFAKSAGEGALQGIGPDVLHSALKLTGGALATGGAGPFAAAPATPTSDQQMRQAAMEGAGQQAHDYATAHMGDVAAQGGRFLGQAVPATVAAGAIPEIELPGAVGAGAMGVASRVAGRTVTNALRGVAGVTPTVGPTNAPVVRQLAEGGIAGAVLPGFARKAGETGAALGGTLHGIVEPLTETGRGKIADRMIRARAAGSNISNPDLTEYIPGSRPTTAEALGNTGLAIAQRSMTNTPAFTELGRANAEAREAIVSGLKGDTARRDALVAARDAEADPLLERAFANPQPVDSSPVVAKIDEILASKAGQRDAVRGPLEEVRAKLDGQTDPEQLYGIRQHIGDILGPLARGTAKDARAASAQLQSVMHTLDPVIEQGAPGFKDYLERFSTLSNPINEHDYLQGLNLTTPTGQVTANQVGSAIRTINKQRNMGGVNSAKAISDETLMTLQNLRDDLARQSQNQLGRGQGSDSTQKLLENAMTGTTAMHPLLGAGVAAAGLTHNPVFGAIAGLGLVHRAAAEVGRGGIMRAYESRLLNPDLGLAALQSQQRGLPNALQGIGNLARPTGVPLSALGVDWLMNRQPGIQSTSLVGTNSQ